MNFRVRNPVPAEFVGLDNYIRIATSKLQIPNFEFVRLVLFNLWWAFSNVVVHVIIGVARRGAAQHPGPLFRGIYRAIFILPVVIPPIIVATVWRNMFDPDARRGELGLQAHRRPVRDPGRAPGLPPRLAAPGRRTRSRSSRCRSRSSRCSPRTRWLGWPLNSVVATGALQSHPRRAVRGRRDGRRQPVAEVPERDRPVPAAGDAAVRDLRLRHHVQPVLPAVLHDGRASRSGGPRSS